MQHCGRCFMDAVSRLFCGARTDNNPNEYKDPSESSLLPSTQSHCASTRDNVCNSDNGQSGCIIVHHAIGASYKPETVGGIETLSESDDENHSADNDTAVTKRSDEKKDQDDSESPTIPFKLTDSWKLIIMKGAFLSCWHSFVKNLTAVLHLVDDLYSKQAFSKADFDHVGAVFDSKGLTAGRYELLLQIWRNSCYECFLDSLQHATEQASHKELSEAIMRHIREISKILKKTIDVSEEFLGNLCFIEAITAEAKNDILRQERSVRAECLVTYLSPEGKCTPAFEKCIYIVCQAPPFIDAKRALHDYLQFTEKQQEAWHEVVDALSSAMPCVPVALQMVTCGNDELQQKICNIVKLLFKDDLIPQIFKEFECILQTVKDGSIILDLEFRSVQGILRFWLEYIDGSLKTKLRKYVLTPEVYQAAAGTDVDLCLEINERDLLHTLKVLIIRQGMRK